MRIRMLCRKIHLVIFIHSVILLPLSLLAFHGIHNYCHYPCRLICHRVLSWLIVLFDFHRDQFFVLTSPTCQNRIHLMRMCITKAFPIATLISLFRLHPVQNTGEIPLAEQPAAPVEPAAPSVWTEHTTTQGRPYYYNSLTGLTQWTKPYDLLSDLEKELSGLPWDELTSPEGKKYYHNKNTNETTWNQPQEWIDIVERHRAIEAKKSAAAAPLSSVPLARPVVNPHFSSIYAARHC